MERSNMQRTIKGQWFKEISIDVTQWPTVNSNCQWFRVGSSLPKCLLWGVSCLQSTTPGLCSNSNMLTKPCTRNCWITAEYSTCIDASTVSPFQDLFFVYHHPLIYTPKVGSHRIGKHVGIFPIYEAFFWCRFYSGVFNMLKPRCAKRACPGRMPEARVQPVTGHATGLPSCQCYA